VQLLECCDKDNGKNAKTEKNGTNKYEDTRTKQKRMQSHLELHLQREVKSRSDSVQQILPSSCLAEVLFSIKKTSF